MSERELRRLLARVPADRAAEERVWSVVHAAYAEREPVRGRRPFRTGVVLALLAAAIAAAAVLSPPGRAVVDAVRRTIGVEHAAPALFRLPAPGRVLVAGSGGTWVIAADGSKRRLGDYRQATWSPHGFFVAAARGDELATIDPRSGDVHWTLARPRISALGWGGSRIDTRISYLSGGVLHVVGGDGVGDRALGAVAVVAPAWRPGNRRVLAYVTVGGRLVVVDADDGVVRLRTPPYARPRLLAWAPDGRRLVLATARRLVIVAADSGRTHVYPIPDVRRIAFTAGGGVALLRGRSILELRGGEVGTLFSAPGTLRGLAASPDGRWLLTSLPRADQWIFLGGRRVLAVSHIAAQFGGEPELDGWAPGA